MGGRNWQWLGTQSTHPTGFTYPFEQGEQDERLAMGLPYVRSAWDRWLADRSTDGRLQARTSCSSRSNAAVPVLRINPTVPSQLGLLLTCRHHCCEAMASFALEGMLDAIVGTDELGQ